MSNTWNEFVASSIEALEKRDKELDGVNECDLYELADELTRLNGNELIQLVKDNWSLINTLPSS